MRKNGRTKPMIPPVILRVKNELFNNPKILRNASIATKITGTNKNQIEGSSMLLNLNFIGYKITAIKNPKYMVKHREHTANLYPKR